MFSVSQPDLDNSNIYNELHFHLEKVLLAFEILIFKNKFREDMQIFQIRNQEFFRAGEVSWNKGPSTNKSLTSHERKFPHGKISEFLS